MIAPKDSVSNGGTPNGAPVAGIGEPGSQDDGAVVAGDGIAPRTGDPGSQDTFTEAAVTDPGYRNSRKVYLNGQQHTDIRVPFREISLAPTKSLDGKIEVNEPVRVYDTSG